MATELNPKTFFKYNIVDACSIWNILSSKLLYQSATSQVSKCLFSCTQYVKYECLINPRNNETDSENKLKQILINERKKGIQFKEYSLNIEDLQDLEVLENRKKLGKGELSSIIFAKKTRQAFITDDNKARKLADKVMDNNMVQTTPHLLGWLLYSNFLTDSDKDVVIMEHNQFRTSKWGNLSNFFNTMYVKALEQRLKDQN